VPFLIYWPCSDWDTLFIFRDTKSVKRQTDAYYIPTKVSGDSTLTYHDSYVTRGKTWLFQFYPCHIVALLPKIQGNIP